MPKSLVCGRVPIRVPGLLLHLAPHAHTERARGRFRIETHGTARRLDAHTDRALCVWTMPAPSETILVTLSSTEDGTHSGTQETGLLDRDQTARRRRSS